MRTFLSCNSKSYKVFRTIVQGILSVIIGNLPDYLGLFHVPPEYMPFIVPIIMAILTPIMASIGESLEMQDLKAYDDEANDNVDVEVL